MNDHVQEAVEEARVLGSDGLRQLQHAEAMARQGGEGEAGQAGGPQTVVSHRRGEGQAVVQRRPAREQRHRGHRGGDSGDSSAPHLHRFS